MNRVNRRGHNEQLFVGHLKLKDLKEQDGLNNRYLFKDHIPAYPRPEFHVSHLKHDTDRVGLRGIRRDGGFRNPADGSLLWWSLVVGSDEIRSAERRLLETTYPDRTEEQAQKQQSFLEKFATSPVFMESSRLGSYRFTFPLEEVLKAYRDQFCSGAQPVMRVFRTVLYKQEVMYAVLVHRPANQQLFSDLPLLTDDPNSVCTYRDGHFIWRSEAMCETHRYKLLRRDDEKQMEAEELAYHHQFYVWHHAAVAMHVEDSDSNWLGLG
ncbi:uncharacterized protein LOC127360403 isoform X2 [Dicentrarchus labrax]|uniref:uncharacterized protein LOC127360403 isoform X2 n=1 Tax=Dicentrarchus labrax TaxID=13489 RepID=UPI0021F648C8|nr:uncharacterized protein LOC127360403 isoform X2 [Dicentrarchus labrax]